MIAGTYDLYVMCAVFGCVHGGFGKPSELRISDYQSRAEALRAARKKGWKLKWNPPENGPDAVCPVCRKEGKK